MGLDLTLVLLTGRLRSLNLPRRSRLVSPIYCRLQRLHFKVFRYSFFRRHTDVFQSPYKWFFLVRYAIMAFGNGNGKVPANNIPGSLGCSRRPDRLGIPRHSFLPRFCWIVAIMKTANKVSRVLNGRGQIPGEMRKIESAVSALPKSVSLIFSRW